MINADYKSFVDKKDLKQLRKTIRRINKDRFPEQYKFVQNTIIQRESERKKQEELIENALIANDHVININPETEFTKENINHQLQTLADEEDDYIVFEKSYHVFLRIIGNPSKGFYAEYKNYKNEMYCSINKKLDIDLITKLSYSYCNNESYWQDYCEWELSNDKKIIIPDYVNTIERISFILGIILLIFFIYISKTHNFESDYYFGINIMDIILVTFYFLLLGSLGGFIMWFKTGEKENVYYYRRFGFYFVIFLTFVRVIWLIGKGY
jgi:hypothetical protein